MSEDSRNDRPSEGRAVRRRTVLGALGALAIGPVGSSQARATAQDAAAGPVVYTTVSGVGSEAGIYAVEAYTGEVRWHRADVTEIAGWAPTVVDGVLYTSGSTGGSSTADREGSVHALDAATGEELWVFEEPAEQIRVAPTVVDGTVYAGCQDEHLYAIDAATGTLEWRVDLDSAVQVPATVVDGTAYVGAGLDIVAVDVASGTETWRTEVAWASGGERTAVVDGRVFLGSVESVMALDASTGAVDWETTLDPSVGGLEGVTYYDGTVYVGGYGEGAIYALDAATGELEWVFDDPDDGIPVVPTVAYGRVYASTGTVANEKETYLYAIDAETGHLDWRYEDDSDALRVSPTVYNGRLYTGNRHGELVVLDALTGEKRGVEKFIDIGSISSAPTVVADPESGHGVGTRALLGGLGHHDRSVFTVSGPTEPLEPSIEYEVVHPTADADVTLDATASRPAEEILRYEWRLVGEPLETTGPTLRGSFAHPGSYEFSLWLVAEGGSMARTEATVSASELRPSADEYADPETGYVSAAGMDAAIEDHQGGWIDDATFQTVLEARVLHQQP